MLLDPTNLRRKKKKKKILFLSGYGFINLDPQRSEFLTVFEFFVNMFWRGEGFGCMWVPFEFGFFTTFYDL